LDIRYSRYLGIYGPQLRDAKYSRYYGYLGIYGPQLKDSMYSGNIWAAPQGMPEAGATGGQIDSGNNIMFEA
jgi:hypothetical protein